MIRTHHPDQGHAVDIVPLGNHLGSDQQVDLPGVEPPQQPLHVATPAHRVAIHPADPRAGKQFAELLLALLRARAEEVDVLARAPRTALRNRRAIAAEVTLQPLS